MLQDVGKTFVGRKEHVADLVLIQNGLGLLQTYYVEIILQDTRIFEYINPAVDKGLQIPGVPFQIATPEVPGHDRPRRRMSLQVRQEFRRILLCHLDLNFAGGGPIVNHAGDH